MPYNRPGPGVYVVNEGGAFRHGTPVLNSQFAGVAVKQKTREWSDGLAVQAVIDPNEEYYIITKGVVQILATSPPAYDPDAPAYDLSGAAKGDPVWISADGTLDTASGDAKFGRVIEVPSERGTPPDRIRIDLDARDFDGASAGGSNGGGA